MKPIKNWKKFNEEIDISKFTDEDLSIINNNKEKNKDNNVVIFNVRDDGSIYDNQVLYIDDPVDMLVNKKGRNSDLSILTLISNQAENKCESYFSNIPKQISSHFTPGMNQLDDNKDAEIIQFLLNNKKSLH